MSKWIAVLAMSVALASSAPAAAPRQQAVATTPLPPAAFVLPASADVLAGLDLKRIFASPLYAQLKAGDLSSFAGALPAERVATIKKDVTEGIAKAMNDAEAAIGIRPDRDLDYVVMAVSNLPVAGGTPGQEPDMVMLALGRFDEAAVVRAYEASTRKEGRTPASRDLAGTTLHVTSDGKKETHAFALLDRGTLAFGTPAALEALVTRRSRNEMPLPSNLELMTRLKGLRATASFWLLGGPSVMETIARSKATTAPMPKWFTLTIDEVAGLEVTGEMTTDADAKNLADVIQGGLAMGKMQASNPEVQKQAPGLQNMLSQVVVGSEGRVVRLAAPGAGGTAAIGALAAIAIPSLLRARISANEAAALGDTRTVVSAQAAYSAANGGVYGSMACLSQPATCIKSYKGPTFIDEKLASLETKSGYKRAFQGGPPGARPGSFRSYAYTATPVEPGKTGVRSFCGDDSGVICQDPKGAELTPVGGRCPKGCTPLQ